jgi:hypothetical protein
MSLLRPVVNPFGVAQREGVDLLGELRRNPEAGRELLDQMAGHTRAQIQSAREAREGIVYLLKGARMSLCTPMEYGGHFLELDRALLEEAGVCPRMVFVVGGADTFLDFVSDLPAEIFGWDVEATGVSVAEMRSLRPGLLAAHDAAADVFLTQAGEITDAVEIPQFAHA